MLPLALAAADAERTQAFREAMQSVDRIVLNNTETYPGSKPGVLMEIRGAERVQSLVGTVEVEHRTDHCLCITSPAIQMYAGEQLRFSLTLHHFTRLRDQHGPWLGDVKLTEDSAGRFRQWFADQGYSAFVNGYEQAQQEMKEYEAQWAAFLSRLPGNGAEIPKDREYLGREVEERRIGEFRGRFADAASRISVCWHGLGVLLAFVGENHTAAGFLIRALNHERPDDLRRALAGLEPGDASAWRGAYHQYKEAGRPREGEEPANIRQAVDDEALIKLMSHRLAAENGGYFRYEISDLKWHDTPRIRAFLTEIAEGRHTDTASEEVSMGSDYWALLTLAEMGDARAGQIARDKRRGEAFSTKQRMALEVIQRRFDPQVKLGLEHLTETDSTVAEAAWSHFSGSAEALPLDSLVKLAEQTESYDVRRDVDAVLEKRGLRRMTEKEQRMSLWWKTFARRIDSLENTRKALAEVETWAKTGDESRRRSFLIAKLRYYEGLHLIRIGEYEAARSSLIQADSEEAENELIMANLGTGRINEAEMHARRSVGLGARDAAQLSRRAFVSFARGEFEEAAMDFDASTRLDSIEGNAVLFAHLAHVLSGQKARSRLAAWTNPLGKWDSVDEEEGESARYWPETGILHLQGKMSWAELEARVEAMRGDDRAEAWFAMAIMCRSRGEAEAEKNCLERAVATKEFQSFGYVLALIRLRELISPGG